MKAKTSVVGICLVLLLIPQVQAGSVCSHVTLEWIEAQIPIPPDTRIVFRQPWGDVCEVVLSIEGGLAPAYAGKDFVIAGQMFRNGISLTEETMTGLSDLAEQEQKRAEEKKALAVEKRKMFFKSNFGELASLVSISFSPVRPKDFIYVIIDPACSYCSDLLDHLEEIAIEAKLALKIIIYPVLEDKSRNMAAHAVCEGYSFDEYRGMKTSDGLVSCEKADLTIQKTFDLMNRADIHFVPVVVASNGAWVAEGNGIGEIRANLGLEKITGEKSCGGACGSESTGEF